MPGSKAVKERIEELVAQAPQLTDPIPQRRAWLIAAQNAIQLVCPSDGNPYCAFGQELVRQPDIDLNGLYAYGAADNVCKMAAMLERLLEEIDGGLLTSIENHAIAGTFDDFLDHGDEYLKHNRKNEAGVIAGIVFEDTIRRICRILSVTESGVALDTLITELNKQGVLTALKTKRARAAAGLRTSGRARPVGGDRLRRCGASDRADQGTHRGSPRIAGSQRLAPTLLLRAVPAD
jgi:hypothetical protein